MIKMREFEIILKKKRKFCWIIKIFDLPLHLETISDCFLFENFFKTKATNRKYIASYNK